MGSRVKIMLLQVLNDTHNISEINLNKNVSIRKEKYVSVSDMILLDENMQLLVTDRSFEQNSIDIRSSK